jgi:plasmid stabilization system protein ParE
MGEIVHIVTQQAAERAWEEFRAHAAQGVDNPRLCLDREWMETRRRLERKWQRLFDRIDA